MSESRDWYGSIAEVEALVRAAGDYVQPSEELRPRVLETARAQCGERRVQRCVRQLAVVVILLMAFTASGQGRLDPPTSRDGAVANADSDRLLSLAAAKGVRSGDFGWGMVEAFTEMRREQGEVLRLNP